jgi:hypothetical protein
MWFAFFGARGGQYRAAAGEIMEHKLYVGNLAPTANEYLPHANKPIW